MEMDLLRLLSRSFQGKTLYYSEERVWRDFEFLKQWLSENQDLLDKTISLPYPIFYCNKKYREKFSEFKSSFICRCRDVGSDFSCYNCSGQLLNYNLTPKKFLDMKLKKQKEMKKKAASQGNMNRKCGKTKGRKKK